MDLLTLIGIALALAMDAFAVALAAGVQLNPLTGRQLFRLSFHFGLFQGIMPIIGWLAGLGLRDLIAAFAPWVAFVLLTFVGCKMIYEAFSDADTRSERQDPTRGMTLVLLSIATSIDALAVGFSLSLLGISIWTPAVIIGVVAAILTVTGMLIGRTIASIWGSRVEIIGGIVLVGIGLKILFQHAQM